MKMVDGAEVRLQAQPRVGVEVAVIQVYCKWHKQTLLRSAYGEDANNNNPFMVLFHWT